MSRSTFSILPYINRQKVKADGTANILCRITVDGKSAAISTGISCTLTISVRTPRVGSSSARKERRQAWSSSCHSIR
nr:Arm DNA-binding domain-containing protein [Segatella copri]